jgi:hypothetical protein
MSSSVTGSQDLGSVESHIGRGRCWSLDAELQKPTRLVNPNAAKNGRAKRKRSDDDDKASPKNRYNRDDLMAVLDELREDIEKGAKFQRKFNPYLPDDDLVPGLAELFRRSGLDSAVPGHWQTLLVMIAMAIHPSWDGPKVKWAVWRDPFMNRIAELHREHPGSTRLELCEIFKEERPSDEHWSSAENLRQKVQAFLKKARDHRNENRASEDELRWLRTLGDEE